MPLASSPSPTSNRWPMLIKAGTAGLSGPKRSGDDRAEMRRRDRLRRRIARVPLKLMARMENESQIARRVAANQRAAVHHRGELLQPLRELDVDRRPYGCSEMC